MTAETPAERKRRPARERQRKFRKLKKARKCRAVVECDDVDLPAALVDDGLIDANKDDDPKEIADGLRRLVERWLKSKRDAA